uniref:Uncharacterized protein n=1 Tax=Attheya septentrionalis TaxID=420275 RepID=A0A7S2URT6_9STRA|mmetsp:Transcript_9764/g.17752  ORF Transcript_9764/g.17752 Transcript_9764/m.17752 type:complete len:295 (+) Transcript_9764:56-940(+)
MVYVPETADPMAPSLGSDAQGEEPSASAPGTEEAEPEIAVPSEPAEEEEFVVVPPPPEDSEALVEEPDILLPAPVPVPPPMEEPVLPEPESTVAEEENPIEGIEGRFGDGTIRHGKHLNFALTALCANPDGTGPFENGVRVGLWKHTTQVDGRVVPSQDWRLCQDGSIRLTWYPHMALTALSSKGDGPFYPLLHCGISEIDDAPTPSQKWRLNKDGSIRLVAMTRMLLSSFVLDPLGKSGFKEGVKIGLLNRGIFEVMTSQNWSTTNETGEAIKLYSAVTDENASGWGELVVIK